MCKLFKNEYSYSFIKNYLKKDRMKNVEIIKEAKAIRFFIYIHDGVLLIQIDNKWILKWI